MRYPQATELFSPAYLKEIHMDILPPLLASSPVIFLLCLVAVYMTHLEARNGAIFRAFLFAALALAALFYMLNGGELKLPPLP